MSFFDRKQDSNYKNYINKNTHELITLFLFLSIFSWGRFNNTPD